MSCNSNKKQSNLEEPLYQLKIAYNVLVDQEADNYDVFTMDLDGRNKTNVTNLGGVEWTYYAYDDELYYISDVDTTHRHYYLYKMKADGSLKTKVSTVRLADSWHSSRNQGTEFIVRPHQTIDTAFYILNTSGKVIKKLKPNLKYMNDPAFSPDGSKIVFRGAQQPFKKDQGYLDELYVMNSDGSGLRQLTHYPKNDTTAQWYSYHAGPPKWHPTEDFISYGSFQNGKYSIYAVALDGKKQWKLLPDNKTSSTVWHSWSPDGKWLVYDTNEGDNMPYHIEVLNWETKEAKVLTEKTDYEFHQAPVFVKVKN